MGIYLKNYCDLRRNKVYIFSVVLLKLFKRGYCWLYEIINEKRNHKINFYNIKSKLLVLGAVNTIINDQGCQHVTGRFESIRMLLNKPDGWPTFIQSHLSIKTVE